MKNKDETKQLIKTATSSYSNVKMSRQYNIFIPNTQSICVYYINLLIFLKLFENDKRLW